MDARRNCSNINALSASFSPQGVFYFPDTWKDKMKTYFESLTFLMKHYKSVIEELGGKIRLNISEEKEKYLLKKLI